MLSESKLLKLSSEIQKIKIDGLDEKLSPSVFVREGQIFVSAEDGRGFADYYGEFRGGYPYIHESLTEFAETRGMYWEWQNPGCIVLVE